MALVSLPSQKSRIRHVVVTDCKKLRCTPLQWPPNGMISAFRFVKTGIAIQNLKWTHTHSIMIS
jgi:hypothetical protein